MGLRLKNVSKTFVGKKAVDNISLELDKPGVYGLLGTNGAGKTTTIRMILGIIKKDGGEITWNGKAVDRKSVNFGYLPEERGVYPKVKIWDQLMYFAELKGMKQQEAEEAIKKWAKDLKVEEYTEILKNIIIDLVKKGKYVIMSAHQMATIEEFCSDILILNKGKTVLQGNLKEIKETYPANRVQIDVDQRIDMEIKEFKDLEIENEKNNQYTIKIKDVEKAHELLNQLVAKGVKVNKFEIMKPTLNDIFIEKVG